MTFLIVTAVLLGLTFIPLGFRAVYRESNPGVWLLVGPLKFRVYPGRPKKTGKTDKQPKKTTTNQSEKTAGESNKGGSYRDFQPIIRTVIEFLGHFRRKLRVDHLELKLMLAGDDPSDLAANYGRAWAALGSLMPQLERLFVIKKRDLEVMCDFTSDKTLIFARVDATLTVYRTIHLLSWHGVKILMQLIKLKKLRKGGAKI